MDFCLDYKVLKQQILEDLKQLILIEKLFGEVPVIVLRYANVFGGGKFLKSITIRVVSYQNHAQGNVLQ